MVLGCMLRDNRVIEKVAAILVPEHFYAADHQTIFGSILSMYQSGLFQTVDCYVLGKHLDRRKILLELGGADRIIGFYETALSGANAVYYSRIVLDMARLRRVLEVGADLMRSAVERSGPPAEILADAEQKLSAFAVAETRREALPLGTLVSRVFDSLAERKKKRGLVGVPTGLLLLDECLGGLRGGEVTIVGARPSIGKTALAMTVARSAARADYFVHVISIEMAAEQLAERVVAAMASVNADILRKGLHDVAEAKRMAEHFDEMAATKIAIEYCPGATVAQVRSSCRRAKLRGQCDLVVVDYLQLMTAGDRERKREEAVAKMSREIKTMAGELDVPVLLLSQLNREIEKRTNKRPMLADLRESGSIEQDADVVLLLHRPGFYDRQISPRKATAIVAKNRHGQSDIDIPIAFVPEYVRFENENLGF